MLVLLSVTSAPHRFPVAPHNTFPLLSCTSPAKRRLICRMIASTRLAPGATHSRVISPHLEKTHSEKSTAIVVHAAVLTACFLDTNSSTECNTACHCEKRTPHPRSPPGSKRNSRDYSFYECRVGNELRSTKHETSSVDRAGEIESARGGRSTAKPPYSDMSAVWGPTAG